MEVKNTADLRKMLIDTMKAVKSDRIDYKQASAISSLGGKIISSCQLDIQAAKLISAGVNVNATVSLVEATGRKKAVKVITA